jgi:nucleoside-diphosphate-sugar epimerase
VQKIRRLTAVYHNQSPIMKQRVLVLGANGFIGKRVVAALASSDWALPIAAGRRPVTDSASARVERQQIEATNRAQIARALQGVTAVVNCIAADAKTMVTSAEVLFGAALEQVKQPRIIHLSSTAVYGSVEGNVDESAPLRRDLSAYGTAKVDAEQRAAGYPACVIFRPGIVYGPESTQWSERIGQWLIAHRIGDLGAMGDGYCNLIYIDDLVAAILQAVRLPAIAGQHFNLGLASPPTWNEYFSMYALALDAVPVRRISARRLTLDAKLLAPPRKIAELLAQRIGLRNSGLGAPLPPSLLRLWRQELRLNVARAQSLLNVNWTPLNVGIQLAAQWYLARSAISQ